MFPTIIHQVARSYNKAYTMIEVNDIGEQVATALQYDLEYDNLVMASMRGRAGQILGAGFSGGRAQLGVRTTKAVKTLGCSNLKQMVETDKLVINDYELIDELSHLYNMDNHIKQKKDTQMTLQCVVYCLHG